MHGLGTRLCLFRLHKRPRSRRSSFFGRKVSHRNFGVGSDGLVLILPSDKADIRMRIWNADGSEAEMCGNASRCVGKYAYEKGLVKKETITLETGAGIKVLALDVDKQGKVRKVRVDMGKPSCCRTDPNEDRRAPGESSEPDPLCSRTKLAVYCRLYGQSPLCDFPAGGREPAPVRDRFCHRTPRAFPRESQRGVRKGVGFPAPQNESLGAGSGETMACGTGASATTVAAVLTGLVEKGTPTAVVLNGGELEIEWAEDDHVYMTGPATEVLQACLLKIF